MGIFGSKPRAKPAPAKPPPPPALTAPEAAQLELKRSRDRMSKYSARLAAEMKTLTVQAKEAVGHGKRDVAIMLLKLRKLRQDEVDKISAQITNLEQLVLSIESEASNQAFLRAVADGNSALKAMQDALPLELAQRIMEDAGDVLERQAQIDAAFTTLVGAGPVEDEEDALLQELDALTAARDAAPGASVAGRGTASASTTAALAPSPTSVVASNGSASSSSSVDAGAFPAVPATAPRIYGEVGAGSDRVVAEEGSAPKRPRVAVPS